MFSKNIIGSASKIVFITMALAAVVLTGLHIIDGKDFMMLATMAFSFYFTKSSPAQVSSTNKGIGC